MNNIRLSIFGITLLLVGWLTASFTAETDQPTFSKSSIEAKKQIEKIDSTDNAPANTVKTKPAAGPMVQVK